MLVSYLVSYLRHCVSLCVRRICTKLRVYSTPDKVQTTKYALNISVHILSEYEELFGLRYPLPKLGTLPGPISNIRTAIIRYDTCR